MVKIISFEKAPTAIRNRHEKSPFEPSLDKETIALLLKNFFFYAEKMNFNKIEQKTLLGLDQIDYKTLNRMKDSGDSKQFSWDTYNRIANFLGIIKSLRIIYPRNEELALNWVNVPREIFFGQSAKKFIIQKPQESYQRIEGVRRILDLYRNGTINDVA